MESLNLGTKEIISIGLADKLSVITTLDSINVEFKIVTEDEQTIKQNWTTVLQTVGMRVDCLIDTTGWSEGNYKLYIRVNVAPELPILGPFDFGVS